MVSESRFLSVSLGFCFARADFEKLVLGAVLVQVRCHSSLCNAACEAKLRPNVRGEDEVDIMMNVA